MVRFFLSLSMGLIPFSQLSAQLQYQPSCQLSGGVAYGYIDNYRDPLTVSGTVQFHFYDCNGNLISVEDEHEYEYVSRSSREEIEHVNAPDNACSCQFLPEQAIEELKGSSQGNPTPQNSIIASCEVRNGNAVGYLLSTGRTATVNGTVWFHFYDCNGNYLSSEDETEFEYVSKGVREEIENASAPRGACSCVFEPGGAVE